MLSLHARSSISSFEVPGLFIISPPKSPYHLFKDLHPLLNRLEGLLARLTSGLPKHHLRFQTPRRWDAVLGLEAGVDRWIVMLKIDTHALCLEGGPDYVLHHAAGVLRP